MPVRKGACRINRALISSMTRSAPTETARPILWHRNPSFPPKATHMSVRKSLPTASSIAIAVLAAASIYWFQGGERKSAGQSPPR